ncbi:recombinase family protein [Muricomes intestini]|uniref:recombinase family protein n=2 Tax=Muricomes intestini TaxID=1796634 RepID=UPI002FDDF680
MSPDSQAKLLREYAKKNDIILLDIFYELGVSGRKADKRPEFQRMIGLAKSADHPVDVILVWKFSRFARNQEESIVYKSLLKKQHNVDVVSVSEPLIEGPFGSLIERIIEWMDEYYSIRLSDEVLRGMKEKALRGGYQAAPCLGYKAVGNGEPFIINEESFKIVDYIFRQFDAHDQDYTAIARSLNEMGYKTQRGNLFEARSVERILKNPFYYGLVVWNGHAAMGTHEVRLTKERFDARIEKIQCRYRSTGRRNISSCRHWLSGLLKCSICGASLSYGSNTHSPGFQCYRYMKGKHTGSHFISEKKAITAVYKYFEMILGGADFEFKYRTPEDDTINEKLTVLQQELDKMASRESRIRLAYENGIDTLEEYKESRERLKMAREDLQKQIQEVESVPQGKIPQKEDVLAQIRTVYDIIRNPDVDYNTKGTVMRSLFEDIVYDKKNGELIFHLYIS